MAPVHVLYINGIELDVSLADWEPVRLGAVSRSFSGAPRSSVRATKRDHRFTGDVAGMPLATAEVLRAFIEGDGHSWNFETAELYSSRGLLAEIQNDPGGISSGSITGKHGKALNAPDGTSITWALGADFEGDRTLLCWRWEVSAWVHYTLIQSGATLTIWKGNAIDTLSNVGDVLYVNGGGTLWLDCNAGDEKFDELAALPFAVPDSWVPDLYSWRSLYAWDPLPYVAASGAAFPRGTVKALGQVGGARRVPTWTGGAYALAEVLDFTLQES